MDWTDHKLVHRLGDRLDLDVKSDASKRRVDAPRLSTSAKVENKRCNSHSLSMPLVELPLIIVRPPLHFYHIPLSSKQARKEENLPHSHSHSLSSFLRRLPVRLFISLAAGGQRSSQSEGWPSERVEIERVKQSDERNIADDLDISYKFPSPLKQKQKQKLE